MIYNYLILNMTGKCLTYLLQFMIHYIPDGITYQWVNIGHQMISVGLCNNYKRKQTIDFEIGEC